MEAESESESEDEPPNGSPGDKANRRSKPIKFGTEALIERVESNGEICFPMKRRRGRFMGVEKTQNRDNSVTVST